MWFNTVVKTINELFELEQDCEIFRIPYNFDGDCDRCGASDGRRVLEVLGECVA